MATKIIVPIVGKRGKKYDIVTLVEWKASEGEHLNKGEVILLVETEKASCDIEAKLNGFLHVLVEAGGKATVGSTVGLIAQTKEELAKLQAIVPEKLAQRINEAAKDEENFFLD